MNKTFDQWMSEVNAILAAKFGGLTSDDLPDMCYADMHADGYSTKQAARAAVRSANGQSEE